MGAGRIEPVTHATDTATAERPQAPQPATGRTDDEPGGPARPTPDFEPAVPPEPDPEHDADDPDGDDEPGGPARPTPDFEPPGSRHP